MNGFYDTWGNPKLRNSDRWSTEAIKGTAAPIPGEEPVRCNKCNWTGAEADLVMANDSEDGELTNAACPKCLTDHYLMNFP